MTPSRSSRPGRLHDDAASTLASDLLTLEQDAVRLLQQGRPQEGFRLIDRRCRMGPPSPQSLVLRAEAFERMGLRDLALVDLCHALDLDPENHLTNRRMMLWGDESDRIEAATKLVRHERDPSIRAQAFQMLKHQPGWASADIQVFERRISGWAAWHEPGTASLHTTGDREQRWLLRAAAEHPFGGRGSFATFDVPCSRKATAQTVSVCVNGRPLATTRIAPARPAPLCRTPTRASQTAREVAVVIPVFADLSSTQACLESVLDSFGASPRSRLIVVDDASPEPALSAYLQDLAKRGSIELLVNGSNLGFVGSINRALAAAPEHDVVLLNADTVVPNSFVERLAAIARSTPGVGTVTPLSNNGEFLSFPRPNRVNPLPHPEVLKTLDQAAARVNAGCVVDLPSGIGFCLYVTRACLEAVGGLSEDYHRGYLEDVDFCLRARAAGFRNVAAPSVVVGHAGSRSFASHKRTLVVRNLAVLEARFPDHRAECAAFMTADPLRAARERIERELGLPVRSPVVLVAVSGPVGAIAQARGRHYVASGRQAILLDVTAAGEDIRVGVRDLSGGVPQSVQFRIGSEAAALQSFLETAGEARIEILDAHRLPASLADLLSRLNRPVDLVLADGGVLPALGQAHLLPARWPSDTAATFEAAPATLPHFDRLVPPDAEAEALLSRAVPSAPRLSVSPRARRVPKKCSEPPHLGLVPVLGSPRERDLIGALASALLRRRPTLSLTVLGGVPGETQLAHSPRVFVTGPIDEGDLDSIRTAHGVTALMIPLGRPLFGHPRVHAARRCACPLAEPDWSGRGSSSHADDLAIPLSASIEELAERMIGWLETIHSPASSEADARRTARC